MAADPETTKPDWDREALLASAFLQALVPVLADLPADRFPRLDDLNALATAHAVVAASGAPIRFVRPERSSGRFEDQYEVRIFRSGLVPTREANWHDLFNALAWLVFPRTKAVLNAHHHRELDARTGNPREAGGRGTPRDVLTLFDENGLIVASADPELARLIAAFQWKELFWTRRAEVQRSMGFFALGHALHEKGLTPFRGITAKAVLFTVEPGWFRLPLAERIADLDRRAAGHFADPSALASTRTLHPLPVLGIPGWTRENEAATYYDDVVQFRPGRVRDAVQAR